MEGLADAALLAVVAIGSVPGASALRRASWPRRSPAAAILLWQALGLAGGLAAVGALLAIGVSGEGTRQGVAGGMASLARRLAHGQLVAPGQPLAVTCVRLAALAAGFTLFTALCGVLVMAFAA